MPSPLSSSSSGRELVSRKTSHVAAHFTAASRAHLAAATQDLILATRVNASVASAGSCASADLSGWSDLRDALSEKLAALGTLTVESIKKTLEPRVEALEKEANEIDALSKKLARAIGVSSEEEEQPDADADDGSDGGCAGGDDGEQRNTKRKPPNSSSFAASSATAAATAAASAAANAANAAASMIWNRWAPGGKKR